MAAFAPPNFNFFKFGRRNRALGPENVSRRPSAVEPSTHTAPAIDMTTPPLVQSHSESVKMSTVLPDVPVVSGTLTAELESLNLLATSARRFDGVKSQPNLPPVAQVSDSFTADLQHLLLPDSSSSIPLPNSKNDTLDEKSTLSKLRSSPRTLGGEEDHEEVNDETNSLSLASDIGHGSTHRSLWPCQNRSGSVLAKSAKTDKETQALYKNQQRAVESADVAALFGPLPLTGSLAESLAPAPAALPRISLGAVYRAWQMTYEVLLEVRGPAMALITKDDAVASLRRVRVFEIDPATMPAPPQYLGKRRLSEVGEVEPRLDTKRRPRQWSYIPGAPAPDENEISALDECMEWSPGMGAVSHHECPQQGSPSGFGDSVRSNATFATPWSTPTSGGNTSTTPPSSPLGSGELECALAAKEKEMEKLNAQLLSEQRGSAERQEQITKLKRMKDALKRRCIAAEQESLRLKHQVKEHQTATKPVPGAPHSRADLSQAETLQLREKVHEQDDHIERLLGENTHLRQVANNQDYQIQWIWYDNLGFSEQISAQFLENEAELQARRSEAEQLHRQVAQLNALLSQARVQLKTT